MKMALKLTVSAILMIASSTSFAYEILRVVPNNDYEQYVLRCDDGDGENVLHYPNNVASQRYLSSRGALNWFYTLEQAAKHACGE